MVSVLGVMKRKFIQLCLLAVMAVVTVEASAQSPVEAKYPYRKEMEKGGFDKVEGRLLKKLAKDSADVAYTYAAYRLYAAEGFVRKNTPLAYQYLITAFKNYIHANGKQLDRLSHDNYSGILFTEEIRSICSQGLREAMDTGSVDAFSRYLDIYSQAPDDLRDSAVWHRDRLEFANACMSGTLEALEQFLLHRPESDFLPRATALRDSLAYTLADDKHTILAFEQYLQHYPASILYSRAQDSLYQIAFHEAAKLDGELYYRSYAERYPASPLTPAATYRADSIEYFRIVKAGDYQSYLTYLDQPYQRRHWYDRGVQELALQALAAQQLEAAGWALMRFNPGTMPALQRQVAEYVHDAYMIPSVRNFPTLYGKYGRWLPATMRRRDSIAYAMNERYEYGILDSCIRAIAPCHEAYMMLQQLIGDDLRYRRHTAAYDKARQYEVYFTRSGEYRKLMALLATSDGADVKAIPLGPNINTEKGDEYCAVVSADDKTLYFTGKNRPDNLGGEDIYYARKNASGNWGKAQIDMGLSHIYGNEAPVSVSTDGSRILTFQGGALYMAERSATGWHRAERLPAHINMSSWQADAMIASNGKALLFAAYGRTERNPDSSVNIYVSLKDSLGHWGTPIELGPMVNTPYEDRSPVLHPDMRTLYFCSEGHGSLGQLDVFVTRRLREDSWTEWSEPVNIGKNINTVDNDCWYRISTDGTRAYFSQRKRSQDLYWLTLPAEMRPDPVAIVTGIVRTADGKGSVKNVHLKWVDLETGVAVGEAQTDPANGKFFIVLPLGHRYGLSVDDATMASNIQEIDLREQRKSTTLEVRLKLAK